MSDMKTPEQQKKNAEKKITSLDALKEKITEVNKRKEKSPDDERTMAHAGTLEQLVKLSDDVMVVHPEVKPPPVYEALSEQAVS